MSSEDDQKRHISRVISAIRDDDLPDNGLSRESNRGTSNDRRGLVPDDEYYVDEDERRQWDYGGSGVDDSGDGEDDRSAKDAGRGGWSLLLDWRLVAALAILVAGLFMVNFSDNDDGRVQEVAAVPMVSAETTLPAREQANVHESAARLEARVAELEQRLAALAASLSALDGEEGVLAAAGNIVTKEELQVLRDQVNAGLKAQQDATRAAVSDLEQRLTRSIDEKVAGADRSQPARAGAASAQATGGWFVNVATYSQRTTADAMAKRLQDSGYSAAIVPTTIASEPSFRVRVTNLPSREAAQRAARELESQLGVRGLWVGES